MNYLWGFMMVTGIVYAAFTGRLPQVTEAALESAREAITLCLTMMGVMSFWVGMLRIAEKVGIVRIAAKKMRPVLRMLFPEIPADHPANRYIAVNMIANMFGLGWAATPAGLKAMKALEQLEKERANPQYLTDDPPEGRMASPEMCTFLIINISSLQLIPVSMIAYRQQYGSVDPAAVVGPALVATTCSTAGAVLFCLIRRMLHSHPEKKRRF